jgi:hypothetical protein
MKHWTGDGAWGVMSASVQTLAAADALSALKKVLILHGYWRRCFNCKIVL